MKVLPAFTALASVTVFLPLTGAIALAHPRFRALEQLDLTPDQQEQVQAIREQARTETEDQRQQLRESRQQLRSLLASDASRDQLQQQHREIQQLHQELASERFEAMLDVREVLTPEQREQLAEMRPRQWRRHSGPQAQ